MAWKSSKPGGGDTTVSKVSFHAVEGSFFSPSIPDAVKYAVPLLHSMPSNEVEVLLGCAIKVVKGSSEDEFSGSMLVQRIGRVI
jgi:hypothetical protein